MEKVVQHISSLLFVHSADSCSFPFRLNISDERMSSWHSFQKPRSTRRTPTQHRARSRNGRRRMMYQMSEDSPSDSVLNKTKEVTAHPTVNSVPSSVTTLASIETPASLVKKKSCSSDHFHHAMPLLVKRETDGTTISVTVCPPLRSIAP